MGPPRRPSGRRDQSVIRQVSTHRHRHREESTRRDERQATFETTASLSSNISVNAKADKAITTDRSIKDLKNFDGKQGTFYLWLAQMEMKLSTSVFRSEADGLRYVHGFLEGTPWTSVRPKIPSVGWGVPCPDPFITVGDLMKHLVDRYGEDNTAEKAMAAMEKLKQRDRQDFNDFYATYQEYQAYFPLAPRQEAWRLLSKLNKQFSEKIKDGTDYNTLQEVVTRCARLQSQVGTSDVSSGSGRANNGNGGNGNNRSRGGRSGNALPNSELPTKYRNLPALNADMREQLMKEGKCFKCREAGHRSGDSHKCPIAKLEKAYQERQSLKPNATDVAAQQEPESGNGGATR